ncbi:kinesin-like protein KIF16B isoform X2 [Lineus longissimus]|uniref:kinesin-like protein KIF16B isoform X2 n=1 Tax=Lineus longissimus TaxID=88925 RepID=UPI002B4D3638
MASVKVAVRVRPLNEREKALDSKIIIDIKGKKTQITNLKLPKSELRTDADHGRERVKDFTFDYSHWSANRADPHYAGQDQVFKDLGRDVIKSAYEGYNACVFAYGQTGSGKSYTMMGKTEEEGLIPRICGGLFSQMKTGGHENITYRTEVSYLEIYNERVRDLLRKNKDHTLRVREHPKDGPYVQDLSKHLVVNFEDIEELMNKGNFNRTTASTNMNDVSSRSHAIFTVVFTQAKFHKNMPSETSSKIHLVDLAGSERADSTGATGQRLKEGASINKSLVTLGNVISVLADLADKSGTRRQVFIPYRDSVLTWLLKDSIGGNAKTVMIATVSPADVNYGETLSTLRYANRAKNIINKPTVNEDQNVRLIRELREEIARLKTLLGGNIDKMVTPRVQEKLCENEARVKVLTEQWAEKWKEAHNILEEEKMALRKEGLGVILDSELPHLIGIDDDILSTGIMLYHLKEGVTTVGASNADVPRDIVLSGLEVEDEHCFFVHEDGKVILHPIEQALCMVNGMYTLEPVRLYQGAVILLGKTNMFRFNHPAEAKQLRRDREMGRYDDQSGCRRLSNLNLSRWSLLSQSMSDLAKSTESLYMSAPLEMEEMHRLQVEELEEKRRMIEEMEARHQTAEKGRMLEQEGKEQELEEKRMLLEKMQQEADAMRKEAELINSRIKKEEDRLKRKSLDIEKQFQSFFAEKEKFHEEAQQEREKMQQEKARDLEEREAERAAFEAEKEEQMAQIQDAINELAEHEAFQIAAAQEAKEELAEALQKVEEESREHKLKLEQDWKRLEDQENLQQQKLKEAEEEVGKKKEQLKIQKEQELKLIEEERRDLENLKEGLSELQQSLVKPYDAESDQLVEESKELVEKKHHLLEEMKSRESEIGARMEQRKEEMRQERENLEKLHEEFETKWTAFEKAMRKAEEDNCISEKENLERERVIMEEERDKLKTAFADWDVRQEEVEKLFEKEFQELDAEKNEGLKKLHAEKEVLLDKERLSVEVIEREIEEKNKLLEEKKKKLTMDEEMISQLESKHLESVVEAEEGKKQLENERLMLSDLARKQEEDAALAKAELDKRKSALESQTQEEICRIEEQRKKLVEMGQESEAELTRKNSIFEAEGEEEDGKVTERPNLIEQLTEGGDAGSNMGKSNQQQLESSRSRMFQEELEKLEKRMEALKIIEDQFVKSEVELDEKRQKFEYERQAELDRIEVEKFKLQELENQERINALVEQEVKKRLYEEKVEREKRRKMEREKDRKEREQEMMKMKRAHDREIEQLRQKYENRPTVNAPSPPVTHQSKANPFAVHMNTDANLQKPAILRNKYSSRNSSLMSIPQSNEEGTAIHIPSFTLRGYGFDTHYEYEVKISVNGDTWSVYRRYNKFRDLQQTMKTVYPAVAGLEFPPRKFFGNRSEKIASERQGKLETFMQNLIKVCEVDLKCPLNPANHKFLSKHVLCEFSTFFKKGVFEMSKHGVC